MNSGNYYLDSYRETQKIREDVLNLAFKSGEGHIASCFSIVELIYCLFHYLLDLSNQIFIDPNKDLFILSKGHASLVLYILMNKVGFLSDENLQSFSSKDSLLGGHPDRLLLPGIVTSTGSLGHGLPIGCGIAYSNKMKNSKKKVVVLVGDGELNEGTNWESVLFARQHKLSNLYLIVDLNSSTSRSTQIDNLTKIFQSFNWNTLEIDGHNISEIITAFSYQTDSKPTAIIAKTIKGKGIREMENNPEWHHKIPNIIQLENFLLELNEKNL